MLCIMALLMKWFSCTSLLALPPSCLCLGMLGFEYWCGHPRFLAILIALKSKDICVILIMIGSPITKRSLIVLPSPFVQAHIFGQRVRLTPKLSRPYRLLCKASFPLEFSDIPVVRGILDVFLGVSPCCDMTVLPGSWVRWFLEVLLLQESCWINLD
jgi:hypothetical protein